MALGFTDYVVVLIISIMVIGLIISEFDTIKRILKGLSELIINIILIGYFSYVVLYKIIWLNSEGFFSTLFYLLLGIGLMVFISSLIIVFISDLYEKKATNLSSAEKRD